MPRPKTFRGRLMLLGLRREYRCLKCEKVLVGSIFMDTSTLKRSFRKRKESKPKLPACPACGKDVRRSHRKGLERLLPFWRVYRCKECRHRFGRFVW